MSKNVTNQSVNANLDIEKISKIYQYISAAIYNAKKVNNQQLVTLLTECDSNVRNIISGK